VQLPASYSSLSTPILHEAAAGPGAKPAMLKTASAAIPEAARLAGVSRPPRLLGAPRRAVRLPHWRRRRTSAGGPRLARQARDPADARESGRYSARNIVYPIAFAAVFDIPAHRPRASEWPASRAWACGRPRRPPRQLPSECAGVLLLAHIQPESAQIPEPPSGPTHTRSPHSPGAYPEQSESCVHCITHPIPSPTTAQRRPAGQSAVSTHRPEPAPQATPAIIAAAATITRATRLFMAHQG
jgi:hypothetical protein